MSTTAVRDGRPEDLVDVLEIASIGTAESALLMLCSLNEAWKAVCMQVSPVSVH